MIVGKNVTPGELRAYVEGRGYRAEPLLTTLATAQGGELRVNGYTLYGPRGNKTVLGMDAEGLLSLDQAQLWCDGVDYANRQVAEKRARA